MQRSRRIECILAVCNLQTPRLVFRLHHCDKNTLLSLFNVPTRNSLNELICRLINNILPILLTMPSNYSRAQKPIHEPRHLRVICIGAGASGLLLSYKLQRSFEHFNLTIYEKNERVSGTWHENTYPGYVSFLRHAILKF